MEDRAPKEPVARTPAALSLSPAHQPGVPLLTFRLLSHQLKIKVRVVPLGQGEALHLSPLGSTSYWLSIRAFGGLRECSPEHSYLPGSEEVGFQQVKVLSSSKIPSTAHQAVLIRGSKPSAICLTNDAVRDGPRDQVRKPAS